jgi:hypothetical protein
MSQLRPRIHPRSSAISCQKVQDNAPPKVRRNHYAVKTVNKSLDILGKKQKSSRHKNVQKVYNTQHLTLFVDLLMSVMRNKLVCTYALSSDIVKKMTVHEVNLNHIETHCR